MLSVIWLVIGVAVAGYSLMMVYEARHHFAKGDTKNGLQQVATGVFFLLCGSMIILWNWNSFAPTGGGREFEQGVAFYKKGDLDTAIASFKHDPEGRSNITFDSVRLTPGGEPLIRWDVSWHYGKHTAAKLESLEVQDEDRSRLRLTFRASSLDGSRTEPCNRPGPRSKPTCRLVRNSANYTDPRDSPDPESAS